MAKTTRDKTFTSQSIDNDAFDDEFRLKKVAAYGWDGSTFVAIRVDEDGNVQVEQNPRTKMPQTFEDTSFVIGDSPVSLDANTALSANATEFEVINDGAGAFTVALSNDGDTFTDEHTVKNGETYGLSNISVDTIRITHVADSAYRVVVL